MLVIVRLTVFQPEASFCASNTDTCYNPEISIVAAKITARKYSPRTI